MFESSVLGENLRTEYRENIWNRVLGEYLEQGTWKILRTGCLEDIENRVLGEYLRTGYLQDI